MITRNDPYPFAAPMMEPLEDRMLLSQTLISAGFPLIKFEGGSLQYEQSTGYLAVQAEPLQYFEVAPEDEYDDPTFYIIPTGTVQRSVLLECQIDAGGNLVKDAGQKPIGTISVTGLLLGSGNTDTSLLTGNIVDFGFLDNLGNTDQWSFEFTVTSVHPSFEGLSGASSVAVEVTGENSTFAGSFVESFHSLAKGQIGLVLRPQSEPASLGDRVWEDRDANGIQDDGEPGIPGVIVNLLDNQGGWVDSTTTDADGIYGFADLDPGTYEVEFEVPAGYSLSIPGQGDDGLDSDADLLTGRTGPITLVSGQTDLTWDAGLVRTGIEVEKLVRTVQPCGGEGLTPGYWKQYHHLDDWAGYSPTDSYDAVFGVDDPSYGLTLLEALRRGGGAHRALGRHAVAALLNAAHPGVDYAYTTSQIIWMVQKAYADGDHEGYKNLLAAENEKGASFCRTRCGSPCPEETEWVPADAEPGLLVPAGRLVEFQYVVTNPGSLPLAGVNILDDNATPLDSTDDFWATPVLQGAYNVGDSDADGLLDAGERWLFSGRTTLVEPGQHVNWATATGTPADGPGGVFATVQAQDPAYWFGVVDEPAIQVVKTGTALATVCDEITYRYEVTNPGDVPLSTISVVDDNGTADSPCDDFHPAPVLKCGYNVGDLDHDNKLDVNETWIYQAQRRPEWAPGRVLTNTVTATGKYGTQTVSDTDSFSLYAVTASKALFLYWDSIEENVPYDVPTCATFTVEASRDGVPVGSFTVSTFSSRNLWLSEGVFEFREVNLPSGYEACNESVAFSPGSAGGSELVFQNVVSFDLAVEKSGPSSARHGDLVTYVYQVTNAGPAKVTPVLTDDLVTPVYIEGDENGDGLIAAGETWVFAADYTVPAGTEGLTVTNTAIVLSAENSKPNGGQWLMGGDVNPANDVSSHTLVVTNAPPVQDSGSLSGFVWVDFNDDGMVDFNEKTIAGVKIRLIRVEGDEAMLVQEVVTDEQGLYEFLGLQPGDYVIQEVQPSAYLDGQESLGTLGGLVSNDRFSLTLLAGENGQNYNFGELPKSTCGIKSGQTATIGFWRNKNGQALIKSLNGGENATQLGNWLAVTFPNLFGATSRTNLAGKRNKDIAAHFQTLFKTAGKKVEAQILATALAVYVTNSSLAGTAATKYGFRVTELGVGVSTFNVGICGMAFDVSNFSRVRVMDLLLSTDARSDSGTLYNGSTVMRCLANMVYTAINEAGDIG